ncbi:MAG: hypothetical protein FWB85_06630 [Chitinispirillia bacterium]|nr:hypothetical protein [Chitinispirillia bacterium]MCL2241898.1 hypothetical protein [Chitinispirillia bacterium]
MKKVIFAVPAVIFICANAAAAQTGGRSVITTPEGIEIVEAVPVEEISRERPRRMALVDDSGAPVADEYQVDDDDEEEKPEFVSIHTVDVIKREVTDTSARAKTSAHENLLGMGGRFYVGNIVGMGGYLKVPVGRISRVDIGLGLGFGARKDGYNWAYHLEGAGSYEWRVDVDDGVLGWYLGPAMSAGWNWTSKEFPDAEKETTDAGGNVVVVPDPHTKHYSGFGLGLGGVLGIEVDLSFIDADHSLYSLKDTSIGMGVKPMFYIRDKHYNGFTFAFVVSVRRAL